MHRHLQVGAPGRHHRHGSGGLRELFIIGLGGDGQEERIQQLQEQAKHDHEYLGGLSSDVEMVMNSASSNELSIKWLRRALERQNKEMVIMQSDLIKRLDVMEQKKQEEKGIMYQEFGQELERTKAYIFKAIGEEI